MNKIQVILYKEWVELRQQKTLLVSMSLLPLLLTFIPMISLYFVGRAPSEGLSNMNQMTAMLNADPTLAGMSKQELGQALVGKQFTLMFLMIPLFIPTFIASYSIVGEKMHRTLEPLLAAPIRVWELLLAKSLAALIPALVISYGFGAILIVGLKYIVITPNVYNAVITPGWLMIFLVCTPLMALIGITATVAISSRVNDPRTAQQVSAVAIVPIIVLVFGQLTGVLVLSPVVALLFSVLLAAIAAISIWIAAKLFQREVILTRWS